MTGLGRAWASLAVSMGLLLTNSTIGAAQEFYRDKKLSVIVGTAAGGGIDTIARLFMEHFGKALEGSPTFVIQNMPGAAGTRALNYMALQAPKDGMTIIYDLWSPLNQLIKANGIRYDYSKMTLIGALNGGPFLMFARKDVVEGGLARSADIMKAKSLVYGGQQPQLALDIHGRLALNLLKVKYKYVSGYRGAAAIRVALERNEISTTTHGLQGYRSGVANGVVKRGVAVPLWYFQSRDAQGKYVDSPLIKDMPGYLNVYREIHKADPSGIEWEALTLLSDLFGPNFVWGPPGMDQKAIAPLRKAFYAAASNPAFLAKQDKVFGFRYEPIPLKDAQRIVARIDQVDPNLVGFFKNFMK